MSKLIKVISANELVFPQTVAEAVLVNEDTVTTLNKVLDRKLETIITALDSGLTNYKLGTSVILTHTNKITPNDLKQPLLIRHDNNGHILETDSFKVCRIVVNLQAYTQYDGSEDVTTKFGDDFKIDDSNNITLTWGGVIIN